MMPFDFSEIAPLNGRFTVENVTLTFFVSVILELRRMRKEAGMKVDPLPDVSLEPKPKKASGPKVVDIRPMLKDHAAIAARQKVR